MGRPASLKTPPSEGWLSQVWQSQRFSSAGLATSDGQPVRVIYPGRRSRDAGPDFRRAVICLDRNEPQTGDVELHVHSSQWLAHKHQFDPAYNRVILHVVLRHDCPSATPLQNGSLAPVLPLDGHIVTGRTRRGPERLQLEPCPLRDRMGADLLSLLDAAGEARFLEKAAGFAVEAAQLGPGQALYKGVMRALGYSHNKEPLQKLAGEAPLAELESLGSGTEACLAIQARLLGGAGLLPLQRRPRREEDDFSRTLQEIWGKSGGAQSLTDLDWRFRGVRPENWPVRRLAAAACLVSGTPRLLARAEADSGLDSRFAVPAQGYWADHYDLGVTGARGEPLIGPGRAAEIVVNVVLPFLWARGQAAKHPELAERALELYRGRAGADQNRFTRLMKELLFPEDGDLGSARRQQGLLHLYHRFCEDRKCSPCLEWSAATRRI